TWGSAAVALIFIAVGYASHGSIVWTTSVMAAVAAISFILCVALGNETEKAFGKKDPSQCTIDEWAGQAITYIMIPLSSGALCPGTCGCRYSAIIPAAFGFFAFRIFDILKPPPVRQMEKLPKGWGVALDDVLAGLYANIVCQILLRVVL
ncbi:MAG TPA: phosphatidylglycerophosphatase A, partial [Phycisphaerae bacterium]|nr:phosphatidylglycerophosphatase A [Phycisphaerae bacterium]